MILLPSSSGRRQAPSSSASVLDIARGRVPGKDAGAVIAGTRARAAGQDLEQALAAVHAWYDNKGIAAIEKVNPPTSGWGDSLRVGFSTVDYFGTFTALRFGPERRGIAFDAKSMTGQASLGVDHVGGGKHEARNRKRFLAQAQYLYNLQRSHRYAVFFLCYCAELEALWLVRDVAALAAGESITLRTKTRATKSRAASVEHHHPHLVGSLALAGIPQLDTYRPLLDYLSLL